MAKRGCLLPWRRQETTRVGFRTASKVHEPDPCETRSGVIGGFRAAVMPDVLGGRPLGNFVVSGSIESHGGALSV